MRPGVKPNSLRRRYWRSGSSFRKACRSGPLTYSPSAQWHRKNSRTCCEGPFAEVLRASGPMAMVSPFRFSTKYQDEETGLLYYGYRYYDAGTGRWTSKDPLNDICFLRVLLKKAMSRRALSHLKQVLFSHYQFVSNDPLDTLDRFGLLGIPTCGYGCVDPPDWPNPPPTTPTTLFWWAPTPCEKNGPRGSETAFIQVGLGGGTLPGTRGPFVDDGTHGLWSTRANCPPLYPASRGPFFSDQPGNALGSVGLDGLTFEVCRVCIKRCNCQDMSPSAPVTLTGAPAGPPTLPGVKIVGIGPCVTYSIPGPVGANVDLGTYPLRPTFSYDFATILSGSFPDAGAGKCFRCDHPN